MCLSKNGTWVRHWKREVDTGDRIDVRTFHAWNSVNNFVNNNVY